MIKVPDQQARDQALDPKNSFIVQAPAGSGKTSLLTQRYLALLARVKNPEEIIAITFTKKAAAEMQERVIEALQLAQQPEPNSAHLKTTYQLACQALNNNINQGWDLFQNKYRLRILTIDAFCLLLTNRMPLLSKAIPFSMIAEDSSELYRMAAEHCLQNAIKSPELLPAIKSIQQHLANNQQQIIELFILMLQNREQWLKHVITARHVERAYFENVLQQLQQSLVNKALINLTPEIKQALTDIIHYQASHHLKAIHSSHNPFDWQSFSLWQNLAAFLLSSKGEPKKRFTKKDGIPAESTFSCKEEKHTAREIKQKLELVHKFLVGSNTIQHLLQQIQLLPQQAYSDQQWLILQDLLQLLPLLAAELNLVFSQKSQVDFTEIALQSLNALGDETPTELALYLDYEISHILVDEFQDTSKKQFSLLERLTESWIEGDGKTLFVVGDPMQSIYKFREADVSLFLLTQQQGINQINLTSLQLNCNFRSTAGIVNQINHICQAVFPTKENISEGAVSYAASKTLNNDTTEGFNGIRCYSKIAEAQYIAEYITSHPQETIAILVRSRSQLKTIVPYLKQANIAIEGVDLDSLVNNYLIELLLAITKLYLYPTDKLSLASILVSPLCGIDYQTLETLLSKTNNNKYIHLKDYAESINALPAMSQKRIKKIIDIFSYYHSISYRQPLVKAIHSLWQALHGETIVSGEQQQDLSKFWNLLEQQQLLPIDLDMFERKLAKCYSSQTNQCSVKLMTIHKSKGLEFDTVILPGLEYYSSDKNSRLLNWLETADGDLLLSPMHSAFDQQEPLTKYIRSIDKRKDDYERQRLFYVALTRAKRKLILLNSSEKDNDRVTRGSFLSYLTTKIPFNEYLPQLPFTQQQQQDFSRLSDDFFNTPFGQSKPSSQNDLPKNIHPDPQQIIGTFIHEQLEYLSENPKNILNIKINKENVQNRLTNLGLAQTEFNKALNTYQTCLDNITKCNIGQWILKPHNKAENEYQLKTADKQYIIDRTFVENDIRWLIDYKITTDLNKNLDAYQKQLNQYGQLFYEMGEKKIKLMLYYPLLKEYKQWDYHNY